MTTPRYTVTTEWTTRRVIDDRDDLGAPVVTQGAVQLSTLAAVRARLDEVGTRYPAAGATPDGGLWPSPDSTLFRNAAGYTDPRTGDLVETVSVVAGHDEGTLDPRLLAALHRSLTGRSTPVVHTARRWNPITGLDAPKVGA